VVHLGKQQTLPSPAQHTATHTTLNTHPQALHHAPHPWLSGNTFIHPHTPTHPHTHSQVLASLVEEPQDFAHGVELLDSIVKVYTVYSR
jgi:hypothetical protein